MNGLVESIRLHGVIQPVVVRAKDEGYELVAGGRRLEAAKRAGLTELPVVMRECSSREVMEIALVENLQRSDLNPIEAAHAYQRLMAEFGLSQEQVAEQVGKSRPAITNTLRLLNLPAPIQESIMAGRISEGHGRALLSIDSKTRMLEVWQRVEQEGLSVRGTENVAKIHGPAVSRETKRTQIISDPHLRDLEDQLKNALGTRVTIKPRGAGGTIEIEYYSQEDLDRVFTRIAMPRQSE